MKKFFTLAITLMLLVSFSLTSFASVTITHIYKGKSLVEGDNNEYIFTFAKYDDEGDAEDFGVKINGESYSLLKEAADNSAIISNTNEKKAFGIGICDPENALTDKYEVKPYIVIGGVEIEGKSTWIYKPFLYEKMESTGGFDGTAAITDDTNSNTKKYSDWYTPTGIYMQTNIYNGADTGYNESLSRGLIQIDLSKLEGVDPTQPVTLKVVGRAQYKTTTVSENLPDSMTVNVFGFYGYDWKASMSDYVAPEEGEEDTAAPVYEWSESTVNPSKGYIGPRLEELYKMSLLDSFTVARPVDGTTGTLSNGDVVGNEWISYEIDIKDIVASAKRAGEDKVTVAILADNRDRVQYSPTSPAGDDTRDELILIMGSKENTTASRRPSLSYYRYNDEYSQLSTIKVNGAEIEGFAPEKYTYDFSYEKGAGVPEITAECINEESRAVITQATEANKTATIVVYDEQNIRSKTYTVNFIAGIPSETAVSSLAVTADAHSRVNEVAPDATTMYTNLYNGVAYASGLEATLKRGYIQVSIPALENIDLTKDVYLNISGKNSYNTNYITEYCPSEFTVNVYGAYQSEFTWDETTAAAVTDNSFGPNLTKMKEHFVSSFTVAKADAGDSTGNINGPNQTESINITELVKQAINNGDNYVTLIFSADNSDRATDFLTQLKNNDGSKRDNLSFTIYTKEYGTASLRPSVSYHKYNDEYTNLSSIEINGTAITDFDAAAFEYSSTFERGADIPEVTATAFDSDAKVEIIQATEENPVATITVTNGTMAEKIYTVAFTVVEPSYETTLLTAVTADAHSRVGEVAPTAATMFTNLYNGMAYASGLEATLKRGYIQVSIPALENIDLTKDVYLNISGMNSYTTTYITEYCPSEFKVNVYGAYQSEFPWDETTAAAVTGSSFGPDLTKMKEHFVSSFTVAKADAGEATSIYISGPVQTEKINITELVKQAINNGDNYVTLIFSADNSDRATEFLTQLKTEDGNKRDNLSFTIYTKECENESYKPSVTYFAYEAAE